MVASSCPRPRWCSLWKGVQHAVVASNILALNAHWVGKMSWKKSCVRWLAAGSLIVIPGSACRSTKAGHRYVTAKAAPIPLHHRAHHQLGAAESIASSGKKGVVVDGGGGEDHKANGKAFGQTDASKCPIAPAFDDHCFAVDDNTLPLPTMTTSIPTTPIERGVATSASHHQHLHHHRQPHHQSPKRKDRDDASDGKPPYCYNSSLAANKKSRPMSSSGDNGKGRDEWTDTAIGTLLDAYTEKYEHLNWCNLRGRDWEDVATIVSERCNKQKVCKRVEQCNNKNDNLKKRY